jgi:hypothetical protein
VSRVSGRAIWQVVDIVQEQVGERGMCEAQGGVLDSECVWLVRSVRFPLACYGTLTASLPFLCNAFNETRVLAVPSPR